MNTADERAGGGDVRWIESRLRAEAGDARFEPRPRLVADALASLPARATAGRRRLMPQLAAAVALLAGAVALVMVARPTPVARPSAAAALGATLRPLPSSAGAVAEVFTAPLRRSAAAAGLGGPTGVLGRLAGPLGGGWPGS